MQQSITMSATSLNDSFKRGVAQANKGLNKLTKQVLINLIKSGKLCGEVLKNMNFKVMEDFLDKNFRKNINS